MNHNTDPQMGGACLGGPLGKAPCPYVEEPFSHNPGPVVGGVCGKRLQIRNPSPHVNKYGMHCTPTRSQKKSSVNKAQTVFKKFFMLCNTCGLAPKLGGLALPLHQLCVIPLHRVHKYRHVFFGVFFYFLQHL